MRMLSHTTENMFDLHTYYDPECGSWHFGHISYYQQVQEKQNGRARVSNS